MTWTFMGVHDFTVAEEVPDKTGPLPYIQCEYVVDENSYVYY